MNLDEFKKRAEEITKNLQENVVPEIKEKTKKAKDNVVSFVEEKIGKNTNEAEEKPEIIERYVDGEPVGLKNMQETSENSATENSATENPAADTEAGYLNKVKTTVQNSDAEAAEINKEQNGFKDDNEELDRFIAEKDNSERVKGDIVSSASNLKDEFMTTVLPKVKNVTESAGTKIREMAETAAPKVKDAAIIAGNKIKAAASATAPKVKDAASNAGTKIKEKAQDVVPKVKSGVKDAADKISFESYRAKEKAKDKTKDAVTKRIRRNLFPKEYDEHGNRISEIPDNNSSEDTKCGNAHMNPVKSIGSSISKSLNDNNAYSHAKTIFLHKKLVMEHCTKCGIPFQGLTHDLSKFSPSEFLYGVKFFSGDRSPNEGEREDHGYSNAWMHHKGRNKHHFEYWLDYNIEANKAIPVKMPLKYVIEMFCDRVAAGKVYKKDKYTDASPLEYFEKGRARRNIHPETSDFLEKLLKMLSKKGEDYTFAYIRWFMKHHDDY